MSTTAIVLLVIGGLFYAISFFLPDGKKSEEEKITRDEIKSLIDEEMQGAKARIEDMVDETVEYAVEKGERAMEKLSNEKIMEVDEFSGSVLQKINENHNAAVFLYDLLNDKDEKLKNTGEELQISKVELEAEKKQIEERKKADEVERLKEKNRELEKKVEEQKTREPAPEEMVAVDASESGFVPINPERLEIKDGVAVPVKSLPKPQKAKASKPKEDVTVSFAPGTDARKNNNEMIRKLHEEGKSNMQIAKELGLGIGEVNLVVALFASKKD